MTQKRRRATSHNQVTLKDVAEHAGVSQMTVSRVLNRGSIVSEATKSQVHKAIEELNYRPNIIARNLAGGSSYFIGMIYANPSTNYLSELLIGALNKCRSDGHHLLLEDIEPTDDTGDFDDLLRQLRSANLNGVVITPPFSEDQALLETLRRENIPSVSIGFRNEEDVDLGICIDDEQAAFDVISYLSEQGHTRIGCVKGLEDDAFARRRFRGYKAGLDSLSLEYSDTWVAAGDYTYRSGMDAALAILNSPNPPTALFAINDDMAAGAIAACLQKGLKIPEDISIVGFDNSSIAGAIWPKLTTVNQPISDMAARAVALLVDHLKSARTTYNKKNIVQFSHSIVERETVAAPKA